MGTGYTRQSSADIVNGADITAGPLNVEFNAVQAAFNSVTGHTHDGTSGEGPLINLTTSITGVLPVTNGGITAVHKIDATAAPTTGDDSGDGFGPGSIWVDVTNDAAYVCLDASVGAAVWDRISFNTSLDDIAGLAKTDGNIIVGDGSNWVAESGDTARISLGVGTSDSPQFTGIELGHATDTTITRTGAGQIAVEGSGVVLDSDIGTNVQAYDAGLASISGLTTAADKMIYTTGSDAYAVTDLTSFARTILDDVNEAAFKATVNLEIGTDVQAYDAGLQSISGLTTAADKMIYTTASDTYAVADLTSAGRAILDDTDAGAQRTTLGLGSLAVEDASSVAVDIIPDADGTRDLGSNTYRFAELHVDTIKGTGFGFENRLINPLFQVDIEGNAGGIVVDGRHVVEGWAASQSSDVTTLQASRVAGETVPYALKMLVQTGLDASIGATQYALLQTAIEGYDIADAQWGTADAKPVWVCGRIKAPTTGTYCVVVRNGAGERTYVFEVACTAGTWVDFEKEVPGDTSGTWVKTDAPGFLLAFTVASGSTYNTTADTWTAGSFTGTANQANGLATNGNIYEIEDIRVSVGKPIKTEWRPYALDLAHCQRYYEKNGAVIYGTSSPTVNNGYAHWAFKVVKRTTPTITNGFAVGCTVNNISPYGFNVYGTASGSGYPGIPAGAVANARMI